METWIIVAIIIVLIYFTYREPFVTSVPITVAPGTTTQVEFGVITLPAHNSGKPSLWLPNGLAPIYERRELIA